MRRIILSVILVFICSDPAYADGCFVWRNEDVDIREPHQKACLSFYEGIEELVIEVKYEGAVEDFAWLVPLPAAPEVEAIDKYLFEALSKATQDPQVGYNLFYMVEGALGMSDGIADVDILSRQIVGVYDVAILAGGRDGGLTAWLTREGFRIPATGHDVIDEYLERDWVFVAMRIDPSRINDTSVTDALAVGTIDPILFRFPAWEPVYPLRISSISGHPSEVLLYVLADEALIPDSTPNIIWQTGVWGKVHWWHFQKPYGLRYGSHGKAKPDSLYFFEALKDRWQAFDRRPAITKLRAVIEPADMVDLTFRSYDAVAELDADDLAERVQAITYLGYRRDCHGVSKLRRFLRDAREPDVKGEEALRLHHKEKIVDGHDVRSALWALSTIGDPAALPEIKHWSESEDSWCVAEALMALKILDQNLCLKVAVKLLADIDLSNKREYISRGVAITCRDLLVSHGDHGALPGLRRVVKKRYDSSAWKQRDTRSDNPGIHALVASAACGSEWSANELARVLIENGNSWSRRIRGGAINGYPGSILGARLIAQDYHISGDDPLAVITRVLRPRPDIMDTILRAVAADPTNTVIPDEMRAVILSRLSIFTDADGLLLKSIWSKSLTPPLEGGAMRDKKEVKFKVRDRYAETMAAAYALGRQNRFDDLLECWNSMLWDDAQLRGDMMVAFTMTGDQRAVPLILDYVRTSWWIDPRSEEFAVRTFKDGRKYWSWPLDELPDNRYRTDVIHRFLIANAITEVEAMEADESISPAMRAFWTIKTRSWPYRAEQIERLNELIPLLEDCPLRDGLLFKIEHIESVMRKAKL